jgi:hypothetical protein
MQEEMSSNLRPRRQAIATYLQTFILIAVALGGSLLAYREVSAYADSAGGPTIQVWGASLRQGAGAAIERLTVSNSGTSEFPFVTVLNPDFAPLASYCYTVVSATGTDETGTCPSMEVNPTSIRVEANLTSGTTVVVTIIIEGGFVSQGRAYALLVTAPGAEVASEQVVASPG